MAALQFVYNCLSGWAVGLKGAGWCGWFFAALRRLALAIRAELKSSIGSLKKQRWQHSLNELRNGVNSFQAAYRRRIRQPEKVEWGLNWK